MLHVAFVLVKREMGYLGQTINNNVLFPIHLLQVQSVVHNVMDGLEVEALLHFCKWTDS